MADPAGTIYRVAFNASHATGALITNLFTFRAEDGTHTQDDLYNDLAAKCWSVAGGNKWQACNVVFTTLQNLTIDTWPIESATVPAPALHAGTLPVTGALTDWPGPVFKTPPVLAQHAIIRTALAGRSFRGRLYFGPTASAGNGGANMFCDGWRWHADPVARFQAFLDMMVVNYTSILGPPLWTWGVWSRRLGGNLSSGKYVNRPPYHAAGFTPVVNATAMAGIRTQKRREAPRGV